MEKTDSTSCRPLQEVLESDCAVCDLSNKDAFSFREVGVEDIETLRRWFDLYPSRSCDFTVGGVLIWTALYNYRMAIVGEALILTGFDPDSNRQIFYQPVGPMNLDIYKDLVAEYCNLRGIDYCIMIPEENVIESTSEIADEEPGYLRNMMEYLYEAERFATFSGKKMEKKRCHLHFFNNNFSPYTVEPIGKENIPDLITFTLAFEMSHSDSELAEYEAAQIIDVLREYDRYPFFGILVRKDYQILGYSFGEIVGDTFSVHAEKGDVAYRGIYQALSSLMAQAAIEKYPHLRFLNREDDMGIDSLRQSKLSYHPAMVIRKKIL